MDADAWIAVGTWATVLVLTGTLIFLYLQVREATKLRRQQARPYVVPAIDVEQRTLAMLTLENIGTTAAMDVRLDIDPPPKSTIKDFSEVHFVTDVTPTLPPGRKFRASWDLMHTVFDDDYPYPRRYTATVQYTDHTGKPLPPERYVLDFNAFYGQAVGSPDIPEIARELETIRKQLQQWSAKPAGGLLTYNIDGDRRDYLRERELLIREFRKLRQREGWRAAVKEVVRFSFARRWLPAPGWARNRR